jgi:hypothetical protein
LGLNEWRARKSREDGVEMGIRNSGGRKWQPLHCSGKANSGAGTGAVSGSNYFDSAE